MRRFPWALIAAALAFVPLFREIWEVRHLWREPLRLDNARLVGVLGAEPPIHPVLARAYSASPLVEENPRVWHNPVCLK